MVLMAIDHASQMWNGGRLASDSAYLANLFVGGEYWIPGTELDPAQFLTRWITHLCAPTFLFLSGTSLAMSLEKRRAKGMAERELDRHLLIRAGVVLACEGILTLMAGSGLLMLQVLFAIGTSMIAMVGLRRLPTPVLLALGLGWLAGSELFLMRFFPIPADLSTGAIDHFSTIEMLLFVPERKLRRELLPDDPLAGDDAARLGLRTPSARPARDRSRTTGDGEAAPALRLHGAAALVVPSEPERLREHGAAPGRRLGRPVPPHVEVPAGPRLLADGARSDGVRAGLLSADRATTRGASPTRATRSSSSDRRRCSSTCSTSSCSARARTRSPEG